MRAIEDRICRKTLSPPGGGGPPLEPDDDAAGVGGLVFPKSIFGPAADIDMLLLNALGLGGPYFGGLPLDVPPPYGYML